MKIIRRKMQVVETEQAHYVAERCQASINSDGRITLRNYNLLDKNEDEIMVMSEQETKAIFELMRALKNSEIKNEDLPY